MVNRGKKEIEFWVLIIHNFWVGSLLRQTLLNYETNTLDILFKTLVLKFQFSASPLPTHWKKTSSLQSKQPDSVEVLFSLVFTGLVWSMEGECVMTAAAFCCSEVTPPHTHTTTGGVDGDISDGLIYLFPLTSCFWSVTRLLTTLLSLIHRRKKLRGEKKWCLMLRGN